jgi:hypothetical protein
MNKWAQFTIGVISAGATQFGILIGAAAGTAAAAGVTLEINWVVIYAGVIGTMGATAGGLLKSLPRQEWSEEKRDAEQGVIDAKETVAKVETDEKEQS